MINLNCPLVLHDLFSYDIQAAHPSILQKQYFDFRNTNLENKLERNIFIGQQQIDNENLSSFLTESVDSLVKFYLLENNVKEEEVITIQKDGFIVKKLLENNDEFIGMKLREYIDFLIISLDRKKFLYCSEGKITVKGISYYYQELDKIYQLFANLNFCNKTLLFEQLNSIKHSLLQSTNKSLFCIPKDEETLMISTYKGDIEIKNADYVSINSIDKIKYYNHFLKDFLGSIYLEMYDV